MSITRGIEIRHKDPAKALPIHKRPDVSWKSWYVDMWISEWLNQYENKEPPEYYKRRYEDAWEASVRKEDLLRMADDLINRRFNVCPDGYEYFEGDEDTENSMVMYGRAFRRLCDQLQEDEWLIYYDCGN